MGVLKLCLSYLNMEWSFQVFLNLAVNRGQIPRWPNSDFTRSGHYFASFQAAPLSQTYVLITDLQVRAQDWSSRLATTVRVAFVKRLNSAEPSFLHPQKAGGNKELANSKGCCEDQVG